MDRRNAPRILLIEDCPDQRDAFFQNLRTAGFEVDAASCRASAEPLLKKRYDCVILDFNLSDGATGGDLLGTIRATPANSATPVIMISGHQESYKSLAGCLERGATDCLSKPVPIELLEAKIRKLVATGRPPGADGGRVRVLAVEDDPETQELYAAFFKLHKSEFIGEIVSTGNEALEILSDMSEPVGAVLLDWRLDEGTLDGLAVLRALRGLPFGPDVIAFLVTSNDEDAALKAAFEAGADDYILKPFGHIELSARLRGRLNRREPAGTGVEVRLGDIRFDPVSHRVTRGEERLNLFPTELALLRVFLSHPDRPLSRSFLWESVRGCRVNSSGKALTVQISNLRRKLGRYGKRIETWRGDGYLLNTRFPPL